MKPGKKKLPKTYKAAIGMAVTAFLVPIIKANVPGAEEFMTPDIVKAIESLLVALCFVFLRKGMVKEGNEG